MRPVMIERGMKGAPAVRFGDIEEWSGDYVSTLPELLKLVE